VRSCFSSNIIGSPFFFNKKDGAVDLGYLL
jgi:hypothetical protein